MTERTRLARAPEDILIAILTQTESQLTGLSSVQITIDHKSPDLQNIALDSTRNLFVQQSADTYKASQINISVFINILIGVKANGWTLMGTNAFLNNAKQEVVKTFYFEKIGSTRAITSVYAKYNNNASSSSPALRVPATSSYPEIHSENGTTLRSTGQINGISVTGRVTPDSSPNVSSGTSRRASQTKNATETSEKTDDYRTNGTANGTVAHVPHVAHVPNVASSIARRNSYQESTPEPAPAVRQTDYTTANSSSPPPPPDSSKSPTPGAIDFNKFPARLRPSPTGKGEKGGVSTVTSEIQKKNAEYFKRMKKVSFFTDSLICNQATLYFYDMIFIIIVFLIVIFSYLIFL